jgi:malate dehydrogenase (oxaloacetate-decarboxylating)(NADP+)
MVQVRQNPKRVVFAEGEEEGVVRAAISFRQSGLGTPILIGREDRVRANLKALDADGEEIEIHDVRTSPHSNEYAEMLYAKLQRKGYLFRDCHRMATNDRNIFGACMVSLGQADGMVTGVTRSYGVSLQDIRRVVDPRPGESVIGVSLILSKGRTLFVADTNVHEMPTSEDLADIAVQTARVARRFGTEPRVAFLAYSTFGHPPGERSQRLREAVGILEKRKVDFEFDGEMAADVALSPQAMKLYPFCRLSDTANVLVMPAIHSASISTKLVQMLGGSTIIGPMLVGLDKSIQIAPLSGSVNDIVNMAAFAAFDVSA